MFAGGGGGRESAEAADVAKERCWAGRGRVLGPRLLGRRSSFLWLPDELLPYPQDSEWEKRPGLGGNTLETSAEEGELTALCVCVLTGLLGQVAVAA